MQIVSMSLGSERLPGQPFAAVYERVAQRLLASGILIVAAAGNGSNRPFTAVPSTTPRRTRRSWPWPRLIASASSRLFDAGKRAASDATPPALGLHERWSGEPVKPFDVHRRFSF